jgi:hypothetical protein
MGKEDKFLSEMPDGHSTVAIQVAIIKIVKTARGFYISVIHH